MHFEYQKYIPINCSFHDILLDRITRKQMVTIEYYSKDGCQSKQINLVDVFTEQKEEFLVMADKVIIRLDQIISIDSIPLPNIRKSK